VAGRNHQLLVREKRSRAALGRIPQGLSRENFDSVLLWIELSHPKKVILSREGGGLRAINEGRTTTAT
jgi:hypothetical protein